MRKGLIAVLVLVVLLGFAGAVFAAGGGEGAAASGKPTIGFIIPSMANEFWVRLSKFAEKGGEELGYNLVVLDSRDSGDVQIKNAEDLISRKVDGLIFVAYWSTGQRILQMAERAKIPTIVMDTTIEGVQPRGQFKQYIAYIGPFNHKAGYGIADYLFKNMKPGPGGAKEIVALYGTLGTSVAEERREGLETALSEHPDIKLVAAQTANFRRDDGMKVMEDFLMAHPNISAVWCANDEMALGAINAIENAGKQKQIIVGGMDLNDEAVKAILDGRYAFSSGGHWLQGGFAATMMYDYLKGFDVPENQRNVELVLAEVKDKATAIKLQQEWLPFPAWDFKAHSKVYSGKDAVAYTELVIK
jgi:ABC-type sugar transport system substrate-binding protein